MIVKRSWPAPTHPIHAASRRRLRRYAMYQRSGYALSILIAIGVAMSFITALMGDWPLTILFAAWATSNLVILKLSQLLWERMEGSN